MIDLEAIKRRLAEIKEYDLLRRDYYQSSKLTSEFNIERFRELDAKYAQIDIVGIMIDMADSALAKVRELENELFDSKMCIMRQAEKYAKWEAELTPADIVNNYRRELEKERGRIATLEADRLALREALEKCSLILHGAFGAGLVSVQDNIADQALAASDERMKK